MTTVHPALAGSGDGGPVPWHPHDASDVEGEATFLRVKVENLLAGTIDSKEIVISGGADGVIRSDNFETGVSGWAIFGDGSIEARNITIVSAAGSEVDWSHIANVSIDNADINSLSFDKITAATNTASLVIGAGGSIESDNYSAGSAGFQITGAGDIEANDITARGVLISQAGSDIDWTHVSNISVDTADIANAAITNAKIANAAVDTAEIANAAITNAKIDSMSANKLTAGTIDASVISVTNLNASNITTGTITARRYRTASSGDYLDINPGLSGESGSTLRFFRSGTQRGAVGLQFADSAVSVSGVNGWAAKLGASGAEVEARGNDVDIVADAGGMLIHSLSGANQWEILIASTQEVLIGSTGVEIANVYNDTTTGTPNVIVTSGGRMRRDSSREEWKEGIRSWESDGSVLDLEPILFYPTAGNPARGVPMRRTGTRKLLGFGARQAASVNSHFATYDDDGDPLGIAWNSVVTALLDEVRQLRQDVNQLKEAA